VQSRVLQLEPTYLLQVSCGDAKQRSFAMQMLKHLPNAR
jgi:hypothetical protein